MASQEVVFSIGADTSQAGESLDDLRGKLQALGERAKSVAQELANQRVLVALRDNAMDYAVAAEKAAQATREHANALASSLGDMKARTAQSSALRQQVLALGVAEKEQIAILARLESQAKQDETALRSMFIDGRIGAERFVAELERVQSELRQIESMRTPAAPVGGVAPANSAAGFGSELGQNLGLSVGMGPAVATAAAVAAGVLAAKAALEAAARAAVDFAVASVAAAGEAEAANMKLADALAASGQASLANLTRLRESAGEVARSSALTDEQVMGLQQLGLRFGATAAQADALARAATDMSAALGIDANTAAMALAKSLDGDAERLEELIPALQGTSEAAYRAGAAIEIAGAQFSGAAASDAATFKGTLANLKEAWGELQESFGMGLLEGSGITEDLADLTTAINSAQSAALGFSFMIGEGIRLAVDTAKTSLGALKTMIDTLAALPVIGLPFVGASAGMAGLGSMAGSVSFLGTLVQSQMDFEASMRGSSAAATGGGGKGGDGKLSVLDEIGKKLGEQIAYNESLNVLAGELYEKDADRLKALESAGSATEAMAESIRKALVSKEISRADADAMLAPLLASATGIMQQAGALATGSKGTMGPETPWWAAADMVGPQSLESMSPNAQADAEARMAAMTQETTVKTELFRIDQERFDLQLAIAEQGMATIEQERALVDLKWEEAEALGRVSEADAKLYADREKRLAQAQRDQQSVGIGRQMYEGFSHALANTAGQFIQMAISGEISGKKLLASMLSDLSQMATMKAIEATALGFMRLANYDPGSASQAFTSAAIWGSLAVGAGVAGAAVGGGKGGGGGEPGGGEGGDGGSVNDFGSARRAATEVEPQGPRVSITIQGGIVGTSSDELARHLEGYLSETMRDSGGRSGSYRG